MLLLSRRIWKLYDLLWGVGRLKLNEPNPSPSAWIVSLVLWHLNVSSSSSMEKPEQFHGCFLFSGCETHFRLTILFLGGPFFILTLSHQIAKSMKYERKKFMAYLGNPLWRFWNELAKLFGLRNWEGEMGCIVMEERGGWQSGLGEREFNRSFR